MEGEGSGYDLVYEKLARDAKPPPVIVSGIYKSGCNCFPGDC